MLLLGLAGWLYYLDRTLAPLADSPTARQMPSPLVLFPPGPLRTIDLGYVRFAAPDELGDNLVRHDDTIVVSLRQREKIVLSVFPPLADSDPETKSMLRNFAQLSGEPEPTYFELRKRALFTRPFRGWAVLERGRRQAKIDALLLAIKSMRPAGDVFFFENEKFGAIVVQAAESSYVELTEKRAGVTQLFLLGTSVDPRRLVAGLLASYEWTSATTDEAELRRLLVNTGLPQLKSSLASSDKNLERIADDDPRLKVIVDEVRARRAKREPERLLAPR